MKKLSEEKYKRRCWECYYFDKYGECHRRSPGRKGFPPVDMNSWCGEFASGNPDTSRPFGIYYPQDMEIKYIDKASGEWCTCPAVIVIEKCNDGLVWASVQTITADGEICEDLSMDGCEFQILKSGIPINGFGEKPTLMDTYHE